jgi:chromosome segregation ATPase
MGPIEEYLCLFNGAIIELMDQLRGGRTLSPSKLTSDDDVSALKQQVQTLEADKWTLTQQVSQLEEKVLLYQKLKLHYIMRLTSIFIKIKNLIEETSQGQNYIARTRVLQAEMDTKMKEISALIQRVDQLGKEKEQSLKTQSELQVDLDQVQRYS